MSIFRLSFQQTKNLKYIYAIRLVRELANQLIVFFLPIYFFTIRFPFMSQFNLSALKEGIFNVAMIYAFTRFVSFLSAIPIAKILTKYGIRHGFLMVIYVIFYLFCCCIYPKKIHI